MREQLDGQPERWVLPGGRSAIRKIPEDANSTGNDIGYVINRGYIEV